jgi:hypothetical protein
MSLEQALNENTAAMRELIAALGGATANAGKGAAADEGKTTSTRTRKPKADDAEDTKGKTSKYTAEDVKAAAVKVKDELGTKVAKQLIADHGADELAKLKPAVYEDFINACEKALNGDDDGNDDGGL